MLTLGESRVGGWEDTCKIRVPLLLNIHLGTCNYIHSFAMLFHMQKMLCYRYICRSRSRNPRLEELAYAWPMAHGPAGWMRVSKNEFIGNSVIIAAKPDVVLA